LFLGKCGGLKRKNQIGDLILPIAAIRGEGTSNDYLPPEVPALPAFELQRAVSTMIRDLSHDYWTGTVYTTNRRVWEHDDRFRDLLRRTRSMAIDMETATIFAAGFANHISTGALLLVSDQPIIPEGVKTEASDQAVTGNYVERHIKIGICARRINARQIVWFAAAGPDLQPLGPGVQLASADNRSQVRHCPSAVAHRRNRGPRRRSQGRWRARQTPRESQIA
jgi:AMP nucleosidase